MAENNDFAVGYAMGQDSGGSNGGGMWSGDGIWAFLLFALMFNGGGYGGGLFGGGGGQALTRAELYDGFAIQNIDSAVRAVQNGISDSTYALTGTITNGFHGVDRAVCDLGHQISDCCCQTQNSIQNVRFDLSTGLCNLGNTIQSGLRDVIDNQNANYRGLMDFMVQEKLSSKDAQIAQLQNQVSQASQTAAFRAAIDASTAEIIRRTGHECPTPAYWVSPPTPVQVPYQGNCGCGC